MNRRHLFNLLVGAALAPEALIKPARTYFLPPRAGWPGNYGFFRDSGAYPGKVITVEDIRRAKRMLAAAEQDQIWCMVVRDGVYVGLEAEARKFNALPRARRLI